MQNQIDLKAEYRETGKKPTKKVRREGFVPGIFYSHGDEPIHIFVDPLDLRGVVYTPEMKIINLNIEGSDGMKECILKDIQFDPVSDKITHFDLYGFKRGQKMSVVVPIALTGTPAGAKEGGVLQHVIHRVGIRCLPKNMPSHLELDVSALNIGQSLQVRDLEIGEIEIDLPEDTTIAAVVKPRVLATTAEEEAEGELEPGEVPEVGEEEEGEGEGEE